MDNKFLRRKSSELAFNLFLFLNGLFSLKVSYAVGAFIARIAYWLTPTENSPGKV